MAHKRGARGYRTSGWAAERINTIKYAADLVVQDEGNIAVVEVVTKYNMDLNIHNSKMIMILKRDQLMKVGGLEEVDHFKHLNSIITRNGHCTKEIRAIISNTKTAFTRKRSLLTCKLFELGKQLLIC